MTDEINLTELRKELKAGFDDALDEARNRALEIFDQLERKINALQSTLEDRNDTIDELKADAEEPPEFEAEVNALLDEVERPVGTLNAFLPQTEYSERALINLSRAAGRM